MKNTEFRFRKLNSIPTVAKLGTSGTKLITSLRRMAISALRIAIKFTRYNGNFQTLEGQNGKFFHYNKNLPWLNWQQIYGPEAAGSLAIHEHNLVSCTAPTLFSANKNIKLQLTKIVTSVSFNNLSSDICLNSYIQYSLALFVMSQ